MAKSVGDTGAGGLRKGNRGTKGLEAGKEDIFTVNGQALNKDVTIDSDENASVAGPLTIASGVTLTVNGNLVVV